MVFRPLTGYTMAKGSYSRIFVGIVFRPLTGYTVTPFIMRAPAVLDSLPSPYGVYRASETKSVPTARDSLPSPYGVYRQNYECFEWIKADSLPSPYGVYPVPEHIIVEYFGDSLPSPYGVYLFPRSFTTPPSAIVFRPLTGYTSKNIQKVTAKHPANQTFSTSIILLYHTPLQKGIP